MKEDILLDVTGNRRHVLYICLSSKYIAEIEMTALDEQRILLEIKRTTICEWFPLFSVY